ncbi:MAG TPA: FAD-binding protein [Allosphingosinicella sp.]|nr:FAD-binding protein [Allosphingosinicella sp.]
MPVEEIVERPPRRTWRNYHKTGTSTLRRRFGLRSAGLGTGRDDLREGAEAVRTWLNEAKDAGVRIRPVGGAWSPSNIQIVEDGWMLNTRRFNRCFRLAPGDFADPAADSDAFLLVEGGIQIDEINDKLEAAGMDRSLRSTGASNGQTIAGACATGTHGSVLGAGGIQDHVCAVQIVTPGGIHWIEPSTPLMSDAFISATGAGQVRRSDEAFAAAQVAVGALGVVTAMVLRTRPLFYLQAILKVIDFRRDDLQLLADGDFRAFSGRHGLPEDPYFVMVITNPYKPFKRKAVVRFLYERTDLSGCRRVETPAELGAGYDSFTMLGWVLHNLPWARGWILQKIMTLAVGKGITEQDKHVGTWGETTETHKPLARLFTGALFFDRADLPRIFERGCAAFAGAGGATAVTLRFMKGPHGLLSPARWAETAGMDCDGPDSPRTRTAFRRMMAVLDEAGIPFTRHWGKFNELDAERVERDYGGDLHRWKRVRDDLLPAADRGLFRTRVLDHWGLTA